MGLFAAKLLELEDKIRFFTRRVALAEVRAADLYGAWLAEAPEEQAEPCNPYQIFVYLPDGSIAVGATVEVFDIEDPAHIDPDTGDFIPWLIGVVTVGAEGYAIFCLPNNDHTLRSRGSLAGYTSADDHASPGRIDLTA